MPVDAREAGDGARGGSAACRRDRRVHGARRRHAVADRRRKGRHHAAEVRRDSGSEGLPRERPRAPDGLPAQLLQRAPGLALRGAVPGRSRNRPLHLRRSERPDLPQRSLLRLQPQRPVGRDLPVGRHGPPGRPREPGARPDRRTGDRLLERDQDRRARLGDLAGDVQELHRPRAVGGRGARHAVPAQDHVRPHRRHGRELEPQRELARPHRPVRRARGPDGELPAPLRHRRVLHELARGPDRPRRRRRLRQAPTGFARGDRVPDPEGAASGDPKPLPDDRRQRQADRHRSEGSRARGPRSEPGSDLHDDEPGRPQPGHRAVRHLPGVALDQRRLARLFPSPPRAGRRGDGDVPGRRPRIDGGRDHGAGHSGPTLQERRQRLLRAGAGHRRLAGRPRGGGANSCQARPRRRRRRASHGVLRTAREQPLQGAGGGRDLRYATDLRQLPAERARRRRDQDLGGRPRGRPRSPVHRQPGRGLPRADAGQPVGHRGRELSQPPEPAGPDMARAREVPVPGRAGRRHDRLREAGLVVLGGHAGLVRQHRLPERPAQPPPRPGERGGGADDVEHGRPEAHQPARRRARPDLPDQVGALREGGWIADQRLQRAGRPRHAGPLPWPRRCDLARRPGLDDLERPAGPPRQRHDRGPPAHRIVRPEARQLQRRLHGLRRRRPARRAAGHHDPRHAGEVTDRERGEALLRERLSRADRDRAARRVAAAACGVP